MKRNSHILFSIAFSTISILTTPAQAGKINKCTDASGKVTYSDKACASNVKAQNINGAPTLTPEQQRDAKLRYLNEQIQYRKSIMRDREEEAALQRKIAAQEAKEKKCALQKIEVDRQRADAANYPYDTWWRNRANAAAKEYQVECSN